MCSGPWFWDQLGVGKGGHIRMRRFLEQNESRKHPRWSAVVVFRHPNMKVSFIPDIAIAFVIRERAA